MLRHPRLRYLTRRYPNIFYLIGNLCVAINYAWELYLFQQIIISRLKPEPVSLMLPTRET